MGSCPHLCLYDGHIVPSWKFVEKVEWVGEPGNSVDPSV